MIIATSVYRQINFPLFTVQGDCQQQAPEVVRLGLFDGAHVANTGAVDRNVEVFNRCQCCIDGSFFGNVENQRGVVGEFAANATTRSRSNRNCYRGVDRGEHAADLFADPARASGNEGAAAVQTERRIRRGTVAGSKRPEEKIGRCAA